MYSSILIFLVPKKLISVTNSMYIEAIYLAIVINIVVL